MGPSIGSNPVLVTDYAVVGALIGLALMHIIYVSIGFDQCSDIGWSYESFV